MKLSEIFRACNVIFGGIYTVNSSFVKQVDMNMLKKSYRKKVLQYHPDTYSGNNPHELKERQDKFVSIVDSYELLVKFILSKEHQKTEKTNYKQPQNTDFSYNSERKIFVPNKKLKFAEFLYYNKVISWNELIKSIVWQRQQRDKLGEIALRWKYLSDGEINLLGKYKKYNELIGEVFIRFNRLSNFQLKTLLYQQQKEQPKIGEFFLHNRKLSRYEVDKYVYMLNEHNSSLS